MQSIFTLTEATSFLSEKTGHQWTEIELLDEAVRFGITLNAVIPPHVKSDLVFIVEGRLKSFPTDERLDFLLEPHKCPNLNRGLAAFFPHHIQMMMLQGEATTETPADFADRTSENVIRKLSERVRVTCAEVRVMPESLNLILRKWQAAGARPRESAASIAPPDVAHSGTPQKAAPGVTPVDDEQTDEWIIRARELANDIWLRELRAC